MDSAVLDLQDVLGDAIKAQLVTDSLTADVVTNPTQNLSYPYVVVGEDSESSENTNKDKLKSSVAANVTVHSNTLVSAKNVAKSVIKAIGPNGLDLTLDSFYDVRRELEANDTTREFRPEGTLYHVLVRVRYTLAHS